MAGKPGRLAVLIGASGVGKSSVAQAGVLVSEDPEATGQLVARLFEFMTPPYYRFDSRTSLEQFVGEVLDLALSGLRKKT